MCVSKEDLQWTSIAWDDDCAEICSVYLESVLDLVRALLMTRDGADCLRWLRDFILCGAEKQESRKSVNETCKISSAMSKYLECIYLKWEKTYKCQLNILSWAAPLLPPVTGNLLSPEPIDQECPKL